MKRSANILVDAGTGNLRSVEYALNGLGADIQRTNRPEDLIPGGRIILPGVGAFAKFMAGLQESDLIEALKQVIQRGDPILGICVGMQALLESSEEMGEHVGLGVIKGKVIRFRESSDIKIPHTGWNQLWPQNGGSPLFVGLSSGAYAYFNHSYYCSIGIPEIISAYTDYILNFPSMIQNENVFGVQFHPEKSQDVGIKILENFLRL